MLRDITEDGAEVFRVRRMKRALGCITFTLQFGIGRKRSRIVSPSQHRVLRRPVALEDAYAIAEEAPGGIRNTSSNSKWKTAPNCRRRCGDRHF